MAYHQHIAADAGAVTATLIAGLEIEFGKAAGTALAARFLEAEAAEFHWDARCEERWLGGYEGADDDGDIELDRVAIRGRIDGTWFAAICIVDGEGDVHGMQARRILGSARAARKAMADAR